MRLPLVLLLLSSHLCLLTPQLFALDPAILVLTPDHHPAPQATLRLARAYSDFADKQAWYNLDIDDPAGSTLPAQLRAYEAAGRFAGKLGPALRLDLEREERLAFTTLQTDAASRCTLPAPAPKDTLIIHHAAGYAITPIATLTATPPALNIIKLQPWGQIEGVFLHGDQPVPNRWLRLTHYPQNGTDRFAPIHLTLTLSALTDDAGHFVFPRVPPGYADLNTWTQPPRTCGIPSELLTIEPNVITHVRLGGVGRPVIGKIDLTQGDYEPSGGFSWLGIHSPETRTPAGPPDLQKMTLAQQDIAWRAWLQTDAGAEYVQNIRTAPPQTGMTFSWNNDGNFHLPCVPPGTYEIHVHEVGDLSFILYWATCTITVPPTTQPFDPTPLDLGTLTLKNSYHP